MIAKTKAIVFKNTNYGESSLISRMYTRNYGIRTYMLQSVKKGKSAIKPSMVMPLSLLEMDVYEKNNANINRVKELKNTSLLLNIHSDMVKKSIGMFMVEILNQCIIEEHCEEELFDFIEAKILELDMEDTNPLYPSLFLLDLAGFIGLAPNRNYDEKTPYFDCEEGEYVAFSNLHTLNAEVSSLLNQLQKGDRPVLSRKNRLELLQGLTHYYQCNIIRSSRGLKSLEILSEVLH